MKINLIVAHCKNYGIGFQNELPWYYKCDMKWFREITSIKNTQFKNPALLMGKNTWFSLPNRPLPKRINYVLSTKLDSPFAYNNIESILDDCREKNVDVLWIIGGARVYDTFVDNDLVDFQYVTIIDKDYECDTFFQPKYKDPKWKLVSSSREKEENTDLIFNVYKNTNKTK
jgi:dihydrofolate reductase